MLLYKFVSRIVNYLFEAESFGRSSKLPRAKKLAARRKLLAAWMGSLSPFKDLENQDALVKF